MESHNIYIWPLCYDNAHLNMIITITKIDAGEVHKEVMPVMPINRVKVTTPLLYFYCQGCTQLCQSQKCWNIQKHCRTLTLTKGRVSLNGHIEVNQNTMYSVCMGVCVQVCVYASTSLTFFHFPGLICQPSTQPEAQPC